MSTLREKRKKERRALRRRKTADWTVVLILCAIAVCCGVGIKTGGSGKIEFEKENLRCVEMIRRYIYKFVFRKDLLALI